MGCNYYKVPEVTVDHGLAVSKYQFAGEYSRSVDTLAIFLNGEHLCTLPDEALDALANLIDAHKAEKISYQEFQDLTNPQKYTQT